jgi:hypothetical protein
LIVHLNSIFVISTSRTHIKSYRVTYFAAISRGKWL